MSITPRQIQEIIRLMARNWVSVNLVVKGKVAHLSLIGPDGYAIWHGKIPILSVVR